MSFLSFLSLVLISLLVWDTDFGCAVVLHRAPQTGYAPSPHANLTSLPSLPQSANSTSLPGLLESANSTTPPPESPTRSLMAGQCAGCTVSEPGYRLYFRWPTISSKEIVLATVVYKVDPNNVTSTITRYSNTTVAASDTTTLDAEGWNSILRTTGVIVENDTPRLNYVSTIYTAPDKPYTVSSLLISPTLYTNNGWLYQTVYDDNAPTELASGCTSDKTPTLYALTPTATPPGYTNPYDAPINASQWYDLVPSDVKMKCPITESKLPLKFLETVKALTDTLTESQDMPFTVEADSSEINPSPTASPLRETRTGRSSASATPLTKSAPLPSSAAPDRSQSQTLLPSQAPPSRSPSSPSPNFPSSRLPSPDVLPLSPSASPPQASPQPVPSQVGSQSAPVPPQADVIIGTQTIAPGSSAITVSGIPLAIGTVPVPEPSRAQGSDPAPLISLSPTNIPAAPIVVDGQTLTPDSDSAPSILSPPADTPAAPIVVDSQTLTPGAPAVTVSGIPVSLAPNPIAIIIGTDSVPIGQPSVPATTAVAPGPIIINSQTLSSGGTAVISFADSQAVSISQVSTALVIGTQTIRPGAPGITTSGTTISLASTPTAIVIGTNTLPVSQAPPSLSATTIASGSIIIGSETLAPGGSAVIPLSGGPAISLAESSEALVVGSQTIVPGAPGITVSGTPISLASIPTAIIIGSSTIPVSQALAPTMTAASGPIVIGSQTLTPRGSAVITLSGGETISLAQSSSALVVGTQTVLPGAPGVTVSGIEYSLAPSGTAVVVDRETIGSVMPSATKMTSGTQVTSETTEESGLSPATTVPGMASRKLPIPASLQRVLASILLGGLLFAM